MDTVLYWAQRLQDIVTAHDVDTQQFEEAMGYFENAVTTRLPDVPFEIAQDALANWGPDGVRRAVAKYRFDQIKQSRRA